MKSDVLAFILNFFVPGAGLAYLTMYKEAVLNLLIVIALGIGVSMYLDPKMLEEGGAYISTAIAGGSGGFAMTKARELNQEKEENSTA
jgi:hypothetical protein